MQLFFCASLILFVVGGGALALELPHYIKTCHKDKPDFNKCALEHAKDALPYILKGDKKWKIPNMIPLVLPRVEVAHSDSLNIVLKNCIVNGMESFEIKDLKFDFLNRHLEATVFNKWLNLDTDYEIDGHILVLPIQGKGPANLTFYDGTFNYGFDYDLVKKSDGKEYIDNIKSKVTFTLGRAYFHFENLFNGNKQLGDQTNIFLNENEADVAKELGATISQTIDAIISNIIKSIANKVPFESIFLKK